MARVDIKSVMCTTSFDHWSASGYKSTHWIIKNKYILKNNEE